MNTLPAWLTAPADRAEVATLALFDLSHPRHADSVAPGARVATVSAADAGRAHWPAFHARFLETGTPAMIAGATADWPAQRAWATAMPAATGADHSADEAAAVAGPALPPLRLPAPSTSASSAATISTDAAALELVPDAVSFQEIATLPLEAVPGVDTAYGHWLFAAAAVRASAGTRALARPAGHSPRASSLRR